MSDLKTANIVTKAWGFAKIKHRGQKYGDRDFIDHPCEVVKILASVGADMNMLAAGYLVDVLEDTDTTEEELLETFGKDIADLVKECTQTDYNTFPALHSRRAVLIKFADRMSNLNNMRKWSEEKQEKYILKCKFWLT